MPEGPECRRTSDCLRNSILNKYITSFNLKPRHKSTGFEHLQCPVQVINVCSYGKKIIINTIDSGCNFVSIVGSLGMTGRFQYFEEAHSNISFVISSTKEASDDIINLYFQDHRYMGNITVFPTTNMPQYLSKFGPDLLQHALQESTWITREKWLSIFTNPKYGKWAICKALLDQGLVAGIGNYLVSELLYYSQIHPESKLNAIPIEKWERLRVVAHKVILLSYQSGGLTISDYISPDGTYGTYNKVAYKKKICPLGYPIVEVKTSNGRTTHMVLALQHLYL